MTQGHEHVDAESCGPDLRFRNRLRREESFSKVESETLGQTSKDCPEQSLLAELAGTRHCAKAPLHFQNLDVRRCLRRQNRIRQKDSSLQLVRDFILVFLRSTRAPQQQQICSSYHCALAAYQAVVRYIAAEFLLPAPGSADR